MSIKLDELTIGEAKEISNLVRGGTLSGGKSTLLKIGSPVFIRTVTHFYTGKIVNMADDFIELGDAAWIADTGRWTEALKTGKLNEVEPFPAGTLVTREGVIDVTPWPHALPREVK